MSAIDIFTRSGAAESTRLGGFFRGIAESWRSYDSYRRTLIELDRLSDRELDDLGLSRHQIRSVAYRAAFNS